MTRGERVGQTMAKAIIEFLHLMYQKDTATRVLCALIKELENHKKEFERR